jgi:hypothetical protein
LPIRKNEATAGADRWKCVKTAASKRVDLRDVLILMTSDPRAAVASVDVLWPFS